jgi:hypothetical protein
VLSQGMWTRGYTRHNYKCCEPNLLLHRRDHVNICLEIPQFRTKCPSLMLFCAVDVYVDALLRIRLEVPPWHTRDCVQLIVYLVQKRNAASTETSTVPGIATVRASCCWDQTYGRFVSFRRHRASGNLTTLSCC